MPFQTSTNQYQISKYIVDPTGVDSPYNTIQAAIDAANTAGIRATIYVRPGTYTEDLTFYDGIEVLGAINIVDSQNLIIIGTHTPPATGFISIGRAILQSATDIFNSAVAGTTGIYLFECSMSITNGYTFNLPNWTGTLVVNDIGDISTNNGFVNNTAGATIFTNNGQVGAGIANSMIANGDVRLDLTFLNCPANISGGTMFINFALFSHTLTISGTATGDIVLGDFFTGADPAIIMNSANEVRLKQTSIDSSAVNAIQGIGAGALVFNSVNYVDSNGVAGTVTKSYTTRLETGELKLDDADNGVLVATAGVVAPIAVGLTGELLGGLTGLDPAFTQTSDGNFTFTSATAAVDRSVTISNTDDSANPSSAHLQLTVGGATSTGDPYVNFLVTGSNTYSMGIDNSGADELKITSGATPSAASTLWSMTTAGERIMPLQSAFLATQEAIQNDLLINQRTTFAIDSEVYDQNNDYNAGTYTFTAPVTGKYFLQFTVRISNADIDTGFYSYGLLTSNRLFEINDMLTQYPADPPYTSNTIVVTCDMDAADTAYATIYIPNAGASQADVDRGGMTFFSGALIC